MVIIIAILNIKIIPITITNAIITVVVVVVVAMIRNLEERNNCESHDNVNSIGNRSWPEMCG